MIIYMEQKETSHTEIAGLNTDRFTIFSRGNRNDDMALVCR